MNANLEKAFSSLSNALDLIGQLQDTLKQVELGVDDAVAALATFEQDATAGRVNRVRNAGMNAETFKQLVDVADSAAQVFSGMRKLAEAGKVQL